MRYIFIFFIFYFLYHFNVLYSKIKIKMVKCIIKWYDIIDKVTFERYNRIFF